MTAHRACLDNLTEAMALPIVAVPSASEVQEPERVDTSHLSVVLARRQQGRIQDYGRRAG